MGKRPMTFCGHSSPQLFTQYFLFLLEPGVSLEKMFLPHCSTSLTINAEGQMKYPQKICATPSYSLMDTAT